LFGEWRESCNHLDGADNSNMYINVPFAQMSSEQFNCVLPQFLCEIQKKDGDIYRPQSLRQIVISLQKFLCMEGRVERFLSDSKYAAIQDTLDRLIRQRTALIKQRAEAGLSLEKKQAEVITKDMEDIMWTTGVLGDRDPKQLVETLFYVLGLHLAIRGRNEHRHLRFQPAQITVKTSDDGRKFLEYREDVHSNAFKTSSEGLRSAGRRQKVTVCSLHSE